MDRRTGIVEAGVGEAQECAGEPRDGIGGQITFGGQDWTPTRPRTEEDDNNDAVARVDKMLDENPLVADVLIGKEYILNCWDPCRDDYDPLVYDAWQLVERKPTPSPTPPTPSPSPAPPPAANTNGVALTLTRGRSHAPVEGASVAAVTPLDLGCECQHLFCPVCSRPPDRFYINMRTGEQRDAFPENVVFGRKLLQCRGCHGHFRNSGALEKHRGPPYYLPHAGGNVPSGAVDIYAIVDGTSVCPPSMTLTPTTAECTRQNSSVVVVHYIALRARCDKRAVCESPDDVTFCSHYVLNPLHRHSPGFAVGIKRWLAEEDSAKMREQLRGERTVRKSVEQQCAKAEAEAESLKSIISALMAQQNQQFQQQQQ